MLTEDRSEQGGLVDPVVRALVAIVKRLSPAEFDEFIELVRNLRQTDDREEYDSWVRASVARSSVRPPIGTAGSPRRP
jgi:hypothetical protein